MDICPSCKSELLEIRKSPLTIGGNKYTHSVKYNCGSISIIMKDGSAKCIRTVLCASNRIVRLEKEIFKLKNAFWCEDPSEQKIIDLLDSENVMGGKNG